MTVRGALRASLESVDIDHLAEDRCAVRVTLTRQLGQHLRQTFVGKAEGEWSPMGEMRCAAAAALQALERTFSAMAGTFEVQELKTVESFDCPAVLVAIRALHNKETFRFVGFCEVRADPREAAAKAALNGTNRFVAWRLAS
jgi:hypothetical protein